MLYIACGKGVEFAVVAILIGFFDLPFYLKQIEPKKIEKNFMAKPINKERRAAAEWKEMTCQGRVYMVYGMSRNKTTARISTILRILLFGFW